MNARQLQEADVGTDLEVVPPVLFNTFKHHAVALRTRIALVAESGIPAFLQAVQYIDVLGTRLMDLYTGTESPRQLSLWVAEQLHQSDHLTPTNFSACLNSEGYAILTHPDNSRWVLRQGDDNTRYIHLHPGRWSPHSVRVKATVLKTAFAVLAYAATHHVNPREREVINAVRGEFLSLPPLGHDLDTDLGLGAIMAILQG